MHFFFDAMSLASPLRRRSLRRSRSCNISPPLASAFPANFTLFISPQFAGYLDKDCCLRVWPRRGLGKTGSLAAALLWAAGRRSYPHRMELVTGATGYVGGRLIERLVREGRAVRALARDPSRRAGVEGIEAVPGDLVRDNGLEAALDGVETAYYLVHSMEPAAGAPGDFGARDRQAAGNFARAAQAAGVERIVYLGGIMPQDARISPHLSSRLEVERILLEAGPASTALSASIIVGAR